MSDLPTPVELAKQLGISPKRIRQYWRDNYPRPLDLKGDWWTPGRDIYKQMVEETIEHFRLLGRRRYK